MCVCPSVFDVFIMFSFCLLFFVFEIPPELSTLCLVSLDCSRQFCGVRGCSGLLPSSPPSSGLFHSMPSCSRLPRVASGVSIFPQAVTDCRALVLVGPRSPQDDYTFLYIAEHFNLVSPPISLCTFMQPARRSLHGTLTHANPASWEDSRARTEATGAETTAAATGAATVSRYRSSYRRSY